MDRIEGLIDKAITPGRWVVKDDSGHKHLASSNDFWRRGQRVVVIGGQIITHAGRRTKPETINV